MLYYWLLVFDLFSGFWLFLVLSDFHPALLLFLIFINSLVWLVLYFYLYW